MCNKANGIWINTHFLALNANNVLIFFNYIFFYPNSSATERDEWLEAISRSIEEYTKKRITFNPSKSLEEVYHIVVIVLFPF